MKHLTILSLCTLLLVACDPAEQTPSTRVPTGNPNAGIVVQEFADIQCPACKAAQSGIVHPILEKYGQAIRYEFMHFPLQSSHRYALIAGEASECAADQGKFWEFIDHAYENQSELNEDVLPEWAEELGLNVDTFKSCLNSHEKRDIVLNDYKKGRDLNVQGTPTFFVNGQLVQNGLETLSAAIEAAIAGSASRL